MIKIGELAPLLICTLLLSGCNSDAYVSQTPVMSRFIGKSPEQIYQQADHALQDRKYNTAISGFNAFITLYPEHEYIEKVHIALIDCYAARGQFEKAIQVIESFTHLYPNSLYCATLEKKKIQIERKQNRDRLYHLAWWKAVKDKHNIHYRQVSGVHAVKE